jgi:hypothetical protein
MRSEIARGRYRRHWKKITLSANSIDELVHNAKPISKKVIAFVDQQFTIRTEHRAITNVHGSALSFFDAGPVPLDQTKSVPGYVNCLPRALVHTRSPRSPYLKTRKAGGLRHSTQIAQVEWSK